MTKMKTVTGVLIAVQEERIRMVADDGAGLLFTLANGVHAPDKLSGLGNSNLRVRVDYTGDPNLLSGVAHAIVALAPNLPTAHL